MGCVRKYTIYETGKFRFMFDFYFNISLFALARLLPGGYRSGHMV